MVIINYKMACLLMDILYTLNTKYKHTFLIELVTDRLKTQF